MNGISGTGTLQPHRHLRPEDILPVSLCSGEVCDEERGHTKEECTGDIAGEISSTRWERNDTHQIGQEDEEEAGEQPRSILRCLVTHTGLDYIVVDIHDKHVHQSGESASVQGR